VVLLASSSHVPFPTNIVRPTMDEMSNKPTLVSCKRTERTAPTGAQPRRASPVSFPLFPLGHLGLLALVLEEPSGTRKGIVMTGRAMVNWHWFAHAMATTSLPAEFGK
jgi:hypothetical protein